MRVRESIDFKRGQTSREAMDIGLKARSRTKDGLKSVFENDLESEGFRIIEVYTYQGVVDSLEFVIYKSLFAGKFNNDKKELVKFLAKWLTKNTEYYLNDLVTHKYLRNTILWQMDLKTWDNYNKK